MNNDQVFNLLEQAETHMQGHLPAVAAYCRKLDIRGTVNRLVTTRMKVDVGMLTEAFVLDSLSGRSPLYRLIQFLEEQDVELLLGEKFPMSTFSDSNLGRALDVLYRTGTSRIITELGIRAVNLFALDTSSISYDTTATNVWGEYEDADGNPLDPGPKLVFGHSKDGHPELKQFMTELLCVDRGVPVFGATLDGNSSDKTSNNRMLTRIGELMKQHGLGKGSFIYVADSAMVTEANLRAAGDNLFVTRLPSNYYDCGKLMTETVGKACWTEIGTLAEEPGCLRRPAAVYKYTEGNVTAAGKEYRAIVVHSDSLDRRRKKKLAKVMSMSASDLRNQLKKCVMEFHCEPDAEAAATKMREMSSRMHSVGTEIVVRTKNRRGRPKKENGPATIQKFVVVPKLVEKKDMVEKEKTIAGCFVLITNVPIDGEKGMTGTELLRLYKGQYGVESDFAFLKDPLVVNDLFLKTPGRIDALGMILIIALMVWRLMERSMRAYVRNTGDKLPGWVKRETDKPTAFMMTTKIQHVKVGIYGGERRVLGTMAPEVMMYLKALGLKPDVFTDKNATVNPHSLKKNR